MMRALCFVAVMMGCGARGDELELDDVPVSTVEQEVTGKDGAFSVSLANTQLNQYTALNADAGAGSTTLTVVSVAALASGATQGNFGALEAGDMLMVIQMRGATIDTTDTTAYGSVTAVGSAGNYELVKVASIASNVITIQTTDCGGLRNSYTTAGRTQVIRVPQLSSLTVNGAGSIVAPAWDGTIGGVVALHVGGTATIDGTISASSGGFRGGAVDNAQTDVNIITFRSTDDGDGGAKGEGIAGDSSTYANGGFSRGAPANAGGGGNGHTSGGGGGANAGLIASYTGAGVMDTSVTGGAAAWPDDPENGTSSGGGRGGYSQSTSNQDALTVGPNVASWGGDNRRNSGGRGGRPVTNDPASKLFMGGGGGAGQSSGNGAAAGGRGGGIVFLLANTVNGGGTVTANGAVGGNTAGADGAGGAGAGGTIVIRANTLSGISATANGGAGGNQNSTGAEANGPGGGGGGGFIATSGGTITRTANGGFGGTTASSSLTEFPTNGASKGGAGTPDAAITGISACIGDLTVSIADSADPVLSGAPLSYTVTATNAGPSRIAGVSVTLTLDIPDLTFVNTTGTDASWTCNFASPILTCTRASIDAATSAPAITVNTNVAVATGTTVTATAQISATTAELSSVNNSDSEDTVVQAVNDPPVNAMPGNQVTTEETPVSFAVSISDPDAGGATVQSQLTVTNGTLTLNTTLGLTFSVGDGTADTTMTFQGTISAINTAMAAISYAPATNFAANATFTIVTNDLGNTGTGGAQSDTDNLTISVSGVNDPPVNTVPGAQTTPEDTPKTLAVSIADVDAGANPVQVQLAVNNGTLTIGTTGLTFQVGDGTADATMTFTGTIAAINTALGSLTYTPTTNFVGNATFQITTDDQGNSGSGGNRTDVDTVAISVTAANDPPTAVDDSRTVSEDSVGTLLNPLTNDSIAPDTGETLTITAITTPANGTAAIVNGNTNVSFTPNANFNGSTSMTYTIDDGNGGTDTGTISITVNSVNDPPDAQNDLRTVAEDSGASTVNVLANDTFAPDVGETLTVTAVTQPANGSAAVGPGGANVTFTPNANFNGLTTFTYTISDGNGASDVASISVTVTPVNDPPNAVDDARTVAEDSAAAAINVLSNDTIAPDVGETLSITAVTQPSGGTVVITGGGTGLTFQPTPAFNGVTTFTYTISDGNGGNDTATVTVTVSGANDPPTAENDTETVAEDSTANVINVLGNDTIAPDVGETLTVTAVTQPANGSAAVGAGGANVTFTPNANFVGSTSFSYTISDGNGGNDTASVSVTVTNVNDIPDARDDLVGVEVTTATAIDVLANDSFAPDTGETLTIVAVSQPNQGTVAITGGGSGLTFDAVDTFIGVTSFTYTISDGNGGGDTATVTVGVGGDTDGDTLPDPYEEEIGTNPLDADSDDDGVKDGAEPSHADDTDGDGAINALDPDSDNDGLYDGTELGVAIAGGGTDPTKGHFIADADPATTTDPLDADSDDGTVIDGAEDANRNGRVDAGETDPNNGADDVGVVDTDGDGLSDALELAIGSNANDADTDDDGVIDGDEPNFADDTDGDNLLNVEDPDSDGDFLKDGTELGITTPDADTNVGNGNFVADEDPASTTSAVDSDTDNGGVDDGDEDANHNGRVDDGERDPNNPDDDDNSVGQMDEDADGVRDDRDNCPGVPNPDQADTDNDDDGDACDADANGGGLNDNLSASGGGCSTSSGTGGALAILILGALMRRKRAALAVAAALVLIPSFARAQNTGDELRDFSVERFQLSSDRNGLLGVEWAESRGHLAVDVGLWLGYANDPLVVSANGDRVGSLVADRTAGGLIVSISPAQFVTLGLEMPVVLSQDRARDMDIGVLTTLTGGGSGALRLIPKLTLLNQKPDGIGVAIVPALMLPTQSSDDDYLGDDGVQFAPELDISKSFGPFRMSWNVGYRLRPKTQMLDLVVDDEIFLRAGFGYRLPRVEVAAALSTAVAAKDPGQGNTAHVEGLFGVNIDLGSAVVFAGMGAGFNEGFGTPDWRMLGGVRFGSKDRVEETTTTTDEPKRDEIDTDGDGVMDWRDNCKEEPEDKDEHKDSDGCPDPDNDSDGVLDGVDKCRDEAGIVENHGCPGVDADVDGVMDHTDKCPTEAEDHDNFQDEDGCPEPDNDADGVSDAQDACPTNNGPPENGGCPDADRDGDGMVDRLDNCPDTKGEQANAGCTTKQLVAITPVKLATREQVAYNRAAIAPKSNKLLDNIAAVLIVQPKLIIEVGVHTDDVGDDAANKALTQKRADAVVAYLVKKGVDASRLAAAGYGEEQPEGDNKTRAGRAQNQRTVFKVISGGMAPKK